MSWWALVFSLVKRPLNNLVPMKQPTIKQPRQQLLVDPVSPGQRVLRRVDAWKLAGAGVVPLVRTVREPTEKSYVANN